ncbi:PIN domain-containing protein [Streptomyces sp. O3]
MTIRPTYLIDKSALERWNRPAAEGRLDELSDQGLLAVCGPTEMEILYSARAADEAERLTDWMSAFTKLYMPDEVWDRAQEVQRKRTPPILSRRLLPSLSVLKIPGEGPVTGVASAHGEGGREVRPVWRRPQMSSRA